VRVVRRAAHTAVAWADSEVVLRNVPTQAWEQSRAAASGRSAIQVVERVVTIPDVAREPARGPRQLDWVDLLQELTAQIDSGAAYDRHMVAIAAALDDVVRAVLRRSGHSSRPPLPRPCG